MKRVLGSLVLVVAFVVGCTDLGKDYCDQKCDCEGCNDAERDACVAKRHAAIEVADAYDCGVEYLDWLDCHTRRNSCEKLGDSDYFTACNESGSSCACESEDKDLDRCTDKASKKGITVYGTH